MMNTFSNRHGLIEAAENTTSSNKLATSGHMSGPRDIFLKRLEWYRNQYRLIKSPGIRLEAVVVESATEPLKRQRATVFRLMSVVIA
jgi:hypothetical protein